MAERYVVIGLAPVRSPWFQEVARWSTAAVVPVEFVKCVSAEEVRARLGSGRAISALLVDAAVPALDRDLVDTARSAGAATLVVSDGRSPRDWASLGASAVLPAEIDRGLLLGALHEHTTAITAPDTGPAPSVGRELPQWKARLLAVTGAGGTGTSTVAAGLAAGLGADPRNQGRVLLADLALDADQAMLHQAADVVPGVQELVEAFRTGVPGPEEVLALTFAGPQQYRLLLGLRRHRDWVTLRPKAVAAALDGLRQAFTTVVADIEPDVEGEAECGSLDVEDRNLLARTTTSHADLVLVTAGPGTQGIHRLVRIIHALVEHGVAPGRVVPVVNRAPRGARARADITAAVARLTADLGRAPEPEAGGESRHPADAVPRVVNPVLFLPERRRVEATVRDRSVEAPNADALARSVEVLLDRLADSVRPGSVDDAPRRVPPGSLGSWNESTG